MLQPDGERSDGAEETVVDDPLPNELSDAPSVKAVDKPKPKSKPHKALKKASTISKKKPVAKEVVEESSESTKDKKIVLLVSQARSEGSQRLSLTRGTSFEDALEIIHETIGCVDVTRKPSLSYKLWTATVKSDAINLGSEEDWAKCIGDIVDAENKKKGVTVPVKIVVPEQYMEFLRAHSKRPAAKPKGKKPALLNLDNSDPNDEGEDEGMAEKEKGFLTQLEKTLNNCQRCGTSKWCKIDQGGNHVNLTFNQHCGWQPALTVSH
ncbi:hypothetical protein SCP_0214740 [Sparassis crispa]|uniref:Uncharacterized protein n=1 Tax=Sparassis crispa TaxID=139825 RepID=A0A401GDJ6_9APHY|nr:hypothetical protein SCP_0214740 [Sparassis crispa]GBE80258.1 hypothetical protein SCP_0214740 [Sparassis crispa]